MEYTIQGSLMPENLYLLAILVIMYCIIIRLTQLRILICSTQDSNFLVVCKPQSKKKKLMNTMLVG